MCVWMCLAMHLSTIVRGLTCKEIFKTFKKDLFIYLSKFLAVLGLYGYVQDFSSCGEQGLLFVAVCRLLIMVPLLLLLQSMGSRVCGRQ